MGFRTLGRDNQDALIGIGKVYSSGDKQSVVSGFGLAPRGCVGDSGVWRFFKPLYIVFICVCFVLSCLPF